MVGQRGEYSNTLLASAAMDKSLINRTLRRCVRGDVYEEVWGFVRSDSSKTASQLIHNGFASLNTTSASHDGAIFEALFFASLIGSGINHVLLGVSYAKLPYSTIDAVVYTKHKGPVMISLKTSLRERWKQNDLEFCIIKQIQPGAFCALATMDAKGWRQPARLLEDGKLLGLNDVIDCNMPSQVDRIIDEIRMRQPVEAYSDPHLGLNRFKAFID